MILGPITPVVFMFVGGAVVALVQKDNDRKRLDDALARLRALGFRTEIPKPFDPRLPVAHDPQVLIDGRARVRVNVTRTRVRGTIDVSVQASSRVTFMIKRARSGFSVADAWPQERCEGMVSRVAPSIERVFDNKGVRRVILAADAIVHDGGYLRAHFSVPSSQVEEVRSIADVLVRLADALDENRFLEIALETERQLPTGATSGASGAPFVIPTGDARK